MRVVRVHLADPDFDAGACSVKFVLTYEGPLKTGRNHTSNRKHAIRKVFQKQLKRLWEVDNLLSGWRIPVRTGSGATVRRAPEWISGQMPTIGSYRFVPLVTEALAVECALEFRVLRPTHAIGHQADVDNQIKVLLDALKMPRQKDDLGTFNEPEECETPFYVLAQDDRLITKISSIQDELLQPVEGRTEIEAADVRVFIDVAIRPRLPNNQNVIFFSQNGAVWDHRYDADVPANLSTLSNRQLQTVATQCIYRIAALAAARTLSNPSRAPWEDIDGELERHSKTYAALWGEIWPTARDIYDELCRRLIGTESVSFSASTLAIKYGSLAGPNPLGDAVAELSALVRRLQS